MRKKVEAATARKSKLSDAIFAYAEHGQMKWSECYDRAPEALRAKYDAAQSALIEIEQAAVSAGKAWRASFGMLCWNR